MTFCIKNLCIIGKAQQSNSRHLAFCLLLQFRQPTKLGYQLPAAPHCLLLLTFQYYPAIKKNTFESVLMRWMKLEPIIQSGVSQKEKHQYSIRTHIYGIQKDANDDPICETAKETQMYRIDFWTLWEKVKVDRFESIAWKPVYYHM